MIKMKGTFTLITDSYMDVEVEEVGDSVVIAQEGDSVHIQIENVEEFANALLSLASRKDC